MKHIALIKPSISSFNLGDKIVSMYVDKIMKSMFPDAFFIDIPAYNQTDKRIEEIVQKCDHLFFCGTGILNNFLSNGIHWRCSPGDFSHKVILFGVGWNKYEDFSPTPETTELLVSNLSTSAIHSIRDDYSKSQFDKFGAFKSLNTSCPTIWELPVKYEFSCDNAIMTVNSSRGSPEYDRDLVLMTASNFKRMYWYPQSPNDFEYAEEIGLKEKAIMLSPTLNSLSDFYSQQNCTYVGSRLHGGIFAMHYGHRAYIVSIDNRAAEIKHDTQIPIYSYSEIDLLEKDLNSPEYPTQALNLEISNSISKWKEQFYEI